MHREQFERVAHGLPIRPGVSACVNRLRRAGFMVGVVSDSYFVAAEILRRRVFTDFALAHTLQFDDDVCTGELHLNPAFAPLRPNADAAPCKSNLVRRLRRDETEPKIAAIWAVGDSVNDLGTLCEADRAFVIEPKWDWLAKKADAMRIESIDALATTVDLTHSVADSLG